MQRRLTAIMLCTILWSGILMAGVKVIVVSTSADGKVDHTATMLLEAERMRMEMREGDKPVNIVIFRGDQDKMIVINVADGEYSEITRADLEKLGEIAADPLAAMRSSMTPEQQAQMEEAMKQLDKLPPDQREMAKKMMKGPMAAAMGQKAEKPKTSYEKISGGASYMSWDCDKYRASLNGEHQSDLWIADLSELDLTRKDFQVFGKMGEFFKAFGKGMDNSLADHFAIGSEEWEKEHGFSGFPVKTEHYENGRLDGTDAVQSITRETFDNSLFEVPTEKKLKKREMPFGKM